jgi:hypothetical protein
MPEKILYGGGYRFEVVEVMEWTQGHFELLSETIRYRFFAWYGTEPIQKYFAFPLYLLCGALFLFESWNNRNDVIKKPNMLQIVLLSFYLFYPFVSLFLGNSFPKMVTYIMPCPICE